MRVARVGGTLRGMNRPTLIAALLLGGTISCDDTVYPSHGSVDVGDGAPEEYTPDWDGVQALLTDHCLVCHGEGRNNRHVLPDLIEQDIVGGGGYYVVPGDLAGSRLWRTLSGETTDEDFGQMPLAGLLPDTHIQHVADWIEAGANIGDGPPDADSDGFLDGIDDCDDADAAVNPDAAELCDGTDNDCDGTIDEDDADDATSWYLDADGDSFGDASGTAVVKCNAPANHVDDNTDCDDLDASALPGGTEVCDGIDNDCSGSVDDGATDARSWYSDGDSDGVGTGTATLACDNPGGLVQATGDCNDADNTIFPGAVEDNCSDPTDYNCDGVVGAVDGDSDGFFACEDCNDADAAINDDATEACDGVDNDCDGSADEAGATGEATFYFDNDGDGVGDTNDSTTACAAPLGYVATDGDCNDNSSSIKPGAAEICDMADNDCNGTVDDAATLPRWPVDADGDGHGSMTQNIEACFQPSGTAGVADDCDDSDGTNYPGNTEVQDGKDQNCDGHIDEAFFTYVHSRDIQPIWDAQCSGCHGFSSNLTITPSNGYGALINVVSTQVSGMRRVVPGDPDASYLMHKLDGTQTSVGGFGGKMPKGGSLSAGDLEIVRTWITEGAPP